MSARCRRLHLSEWDRKLAVDLVGWLALNRDNALHLPYYVDADRFSDLPEDDQSSINDRLRATALAYVERNVDFLSEMMQAGAYVLGYGNPPTRDARTRQLYEIAVLCATTMTDHGEMTPLADAIKAGTGGAGATFRGMAVVS